MILFGAGTYGMKVLNYFGKEQVACLCDNNQERLTSLGGGLTDVELLDLKGLIERGVREEETVAVTPLDDAVSAEIAGQLAAAGISSVRVCDLIDKADWAAMEYVDSLDRKLEFDEAWNERYKRCYVVLPHLQRPDRKLGEMQYYSQEYQDMYLDNFIFCEKRNGVFLDIGGNDPIFINNTYFFEKERGWTGLAFEPNPRKWEKWKIRQTECLNVALGAEDGEQVFVEYKNDTMSGMKGVVDWDGEISQEYKVPTRRIADILKERGIDRVDFVSLDVEGAELSVLQGFDFQECRVDYFCVECDKKVSGYQLRRFLARNGYELIARMWHDDIWMYKK